MRISCLSSLVLAIAFTFTTGAYAGEDDTAVIRRQSQEFSDASVSGDAKVLDKYLDDDVVFINEDGVISSKHDLVSGSAPPPPGITNRLVQSNLQIKLHGDVAVTSFTDNSTANIYGQQTRARFLSTEVWLKKNGAWKMISSQTLALSDDPPQIHLSAGLLDQYAGTYTAAPKLVIRISRKGDELVSSTNGGPAAPLLVEQRDVLFTPGLPRIRRIFERDGAGRISGFIARHEGHGLHFARVA